MAKATRIPGARINSVGLGLAGGIICGACILLMTLFGILFGWFSSALNSLISSYGFLGRLGYDITPFGMLIGTIYGFVEGFVFFWILAMLYNKLR